MTTTRTMRAVAMIGTASLALATTASGQSGHDDLVERLGAGNVPTGAGVVVGQVEAPEDSDYSPAQGNAEFAGKTFILQSGQSGNLPHATQVGKRFYGLATSIAPGVSTIHLYNANTWVGTDFLNYAGGASPPEPTPSGLKIFNHSWAGEASGADFVSIHHRADFVVNRDDVVMIVGMGATQAWTSNLLHHMYNGISVGKTDGLHQTGPTSDGRMKPEIVDVQGATSFATAKVSSVMAVLVETARGNIAGNSDAERSQVLKATLLTGATRNSSWSNNPSSGGSTRGRTSTPLDPVFGAGFADVNRAHLILTGGEQNGANSLPGSATTTHRGWDSMTIGIGQSKFWRLCVTETSDLAAVATWHRDVDTNFSTSSLADFDLTLWRVDGGLTTLVGNAGLAYFSDGNVVSESAVDNVELLFVEDLQPGEYAIELERQDGDSGATGIAALAWLLPAPVGDCSPSGGDGVVDTTDLLLMLSQWGGSGECDVVGGDGLVDVNDLLALLAAWGGDCG